MEFLSTPNSDCELPEPDPDVKERLLAVNQSKINALELLQELCCSEGNVTYSLIVLNPFQVPIFCKEDIFTQNFGVCISPNFHNHRATYMEPIYSTVEDPNLLADKKPNDSTSLYAFLYFLKRIFIQGVENVNKACEIYITDFAMLHSYKKRTVGSIYRNFTLLQYGYSYEKVCLFDCQGSLRAIFGMAYIFSFEFF